MSRIGSAVIGIATVIVFLICLIAGFHCCFLMSLWLQIPLFIFCINWFPDWMKKSTTLGAAISRAFASVLIVLVLQFGYTAWLHSDYFPQFLLN